MIDKATMQELKRVNVSKDADKTKDRIKALWKPLAKDKRQAILDRADLKEVTVARAYTNGSVQAKLIVAFSEVTEVDPLYLTGELDEQRPYDESLVVDFLKNLGYSGVKKASGAKKTKRTVSEKPADSIVPQNKIVQDTEQVHSDTVEEETTEKEDAVVLDCDNAALVINGLTFKNAPSDLANLYSIISKDMSKETKNKIDKLTDEDFVLLLKSQFIQANFDGDRENRLALVKYILVN